MSELSRRSLLAGLAALPVAGCAAVETMVPSEPPVVDPISYASRRDGQFTIPGVPYDQIPAWLQRQVVTYETDMPAGSIVIVSQNGLLHYVLGDSYALRYGIAVGREGLNWRGEAEVYRKAEWPRWRPTDEMIQRDPEQYAQYADGQPGGPTNPLGARAIYLRTVATRADEGIRIHGTPQWRSIGRRASNGCFRMVNHDVVDLYARVQNGARVTVL